jgi:tetratricopeptide (TPR) repeat protein
MKYLTFLFLEIALAVPSTLAQSIDIGRSQEAYSTPVELILNISVDSLQNPAPAGLNVQITNDSGSDSMSAGSQQTDKGGRVIIETTAGVRQIRISGPGIEDYSGTIQIVRQQSHATENIVVRSKGSGTRANGTPGNSDVVAASRLKVPDKAAKEFKSGSKALESKDYAEAKKRFANATAIYGDYGLAYNGMGVAQMSSGDATGARASFQKAITIDDHFAEAYRNLARISLSEHNFEEMDDLLTKSLQTDPLNAWALTYAAYAELQTHKFDLAITHARAANDVPHPGLASVHIVAANALQATGQEGEALAEYQAYLKEDPNGRDAARAKEAIASLGGAASK